MKFGVFWCFCKCYKKCSFLSSNEEQSLFPLRVNSSHHLIKLFSETCYQRGMIKNKQFVSDQSSTLWKKTSWRKFLYKKDIYFQNFCNSDNVMESDSSEVTWSYKSADIAGTRTSLHYYRLSPCNTTQVIFPAYQNLGWSVLDVDVEDGTLVGDLTLHACLSPLPAPD